ncbi:hypothetical protein J6590_099196 [Homalodisca vitripennis]|nr:hypothetical protein J6590_099196 [Homalodisca vitripennis]
MQHVSMLKKSYTGRRWAASRYRDTWSKQIAGSPGSGLKASPARYVAKRLYRCGSICKTEHLLMFNLRPLLTDQWSSTDQNLYQRLQMRCARRLGRGANLLPHVNQKIYRTDGQTDGLTY